MKKWNNNLIKKFSKFLKKIGFNIFNLDIAKWLTAIWCIIWIFSLFLPWFYEWKDLSWNSFSIITWNIGYINIIFFIIILFLIFWDNYKEKMKLYSEIDFRNYIFILFVWFFIVLTWVIEVRFSAWIEYFWKEIKHWSGLILSVVAGIFIITWGFLTRKNFQKNSYEIILDKLKKWRKNEKEKENMSFPF